MSKRTSTLAAALGAAAGLAGVAYYWLLRRPLPQTKGGLRFKGLKAPVEILRDQWAVPHIYAQNVQDLAFAQGFVHAQERLFQMDFNRRLVAGRLSEVLGSVSVPLDRWMRILGMRRAAEAESGLLDDESRSVAEAYAAGVNARIGRGRLPVEFNLLRYKPEPWVVTDSLSWYKMMAWTLSVNWETELMRARLIAALGAEMAAELEPEYFEDWAQVVPPGLDYSCIGKAALERAEQARKFTGPPANMGLGSNNWVISGQRTTTGKPLLANDMHLTIGIPAIWYENHLVGGDLNITGVSFPGVPFFIAGHNGHVAWGFTNGFPDVQDLYMEHLRREADGRVLVEYQGKWEEAQVRQEEIRVKGGEKVVEEVVVTRHGPIINTLAPDFSGEQPLALRWTALEADTMYNGILQMARARDCAEFREALRPWSTPTQNIVYADTDGNIGYSYPGKIPIRAKGDGRTPVPGWTGEYEWVGYIPFEELPHQYNPPQGYIVSANNRPVGKDYAYDLGVDFCSGYRASRIVELVESREKIDVEFIRQMHLDQVSLEGLAFKGYLDELKTDDPELKIVLRKVRAWDGKLAVDSPAAAVFEVFVPLMLKRMLADKLGDLMERYLGKGPTPVLMEGSLFGMRSREWLVKVLGEPDSHWFDLGGGEKRDDVMRLVLRETVDYLKNAQGPDPAKWTWGKQHKMKYTHVLGSVKALDKLLNRGPYPLSGDGNTIWATGTGSFDPTSQVVVGPPFRFIADLEDLNRSLGLLTPGQSGLPASPHYADAIQAWFTGEYHPMLFSREDIDKEAKEHLKLEP
jgi:penicillin amidase